jgi:phthalate 4,5-dioxygenase oxygenase subunit
MKSHENDVLTQVGPGTPMGRMLRQYWTPAIRSSALEADGAPVPVRLFGQDFVAFRTSDGSAGFVDEACPHRGVSLTLARNESNALQCIFHGWKFDVTGKLIDAPAEPAERRAKFCASIKVNRYRVHEAAGVLWVFVGTGEPPKFPDFEFATVPANQVHMRRGVLHYNWLQGVEAHIDSSHVPFLHAGYLVQNRKAGFVEQSNLEALRLMLLDKAPEFDFEATPWGLREGALRDIGNGKANARIREIALPYFTFIPGPPDGQCYARMSTPIDDDTTAEWYIVYDPVRPITEEAIRGQFGYMSDDPDDFASNLGTKANLWGQEREAMKEGHYSGLTKGIAFEDFAVQASMGSRVDRSLEQLGSSDTIIVKVRRMLMEAIEAFEQGRPAPWRDGFDYRNIRSQSVTYAKGEDWRRYAFKGNASGSGRVAEKV